LKKLTPILSEIEGRAVASETFGPGEADGDGFVCAGVAQACDSKND